MVKRTPAGIVATGNDVLSDGFRIACELQRELHELQQAFNWLEQYVLTGFINVDEDEF